MNKSNFHETNTTAHDGTPVRFVYDQEADILEIFFGENEVATGIELTDYIMLRLNRQARRAVSLTLRHFSILTERTMYGPRSYPLTNLDNAPDNLRELALHLVTSMPVSQFMKLSHFQSSPVEQIPFTYVETQQPVMAMMA